MRDIVFEKGEYYHIYNRGVDKRVTFEDPADAWRFLLCLQIFNTVENSGSILESTLIKKGGIPKFGSRASKKDKKKLVNIIAYCLNQNHFHLVLEPLVDNGIQKFMHKLGTGYTKYFNEKNNRSGSLFQGKYKAKHIISNEYLLYLTAYVNLNDRVHKDMNKTWMRKLPFSSMNEYIKKRTQGICAKGIVLSQFKDTKSFINYCENTLETILGNKKKLKEFENMCID